VDDLSAVAQRRLDLREHIAERPWAWLGGAFIAGLWLSRGFLVTYRWAGFVRARRVTEPRSRKDDV
jgi:hypothetical protein